MKTKQFILLAIIAATLTQSCGTIGPRPHYYYTQTPQVVPLFKQKYEGRFLLTSGGGSNTSAKSILGAFSFTNHWAITFDRMKTEMSSRTNYESGNGTYTGAGIGYFTRLLNRGSFEMYAGFGRGSQQDHYIVEELESCTNFWGLDLCNYQLVDKGTSGLVYNKFYVQPTLGTSGHKFDLAFSLRATMLQYVFVTNSINPTYKVWKDVDYINQNRTQFLLEPAITIRGGYKYIKVQAQFAWSGPPTNGKFRYSDHHFSIGIQLAYAKWLDENLPPLRKKSKKRK